MAQPVETSPTVLGPSVTLEEGAGYFLGRHLGWRRGGDGAVLPNLGMLDRALADADFIGTPTYVGTQFGYQAMSLDGSSYIKMPAGMLAATDHAAIAIRCKMASGDHEILSDSNVAVQTEYWRLYADSTDDRLIWEDETKTDVVTPDGSLTWDEWQTILLQWSPEGKYLFINGDIKGNQDTGGDDTGANPGNLCIGRHVAAGPVTTWGTLDVAWIGLWFGPAVGDHLARLTQELDRIQP